MKDFIRINSSDNVIVALNEINKGTILEDIESIRILEDIKPGHKIAIKDINKGEDILKYGYPIGHATENIKKGQWVHTHNIRTNLDGTLEYNYNPNYKDITKINRHKTFMGYKRQNGNVGIRNELLVVPTVGCINGIAEMIVREFKNKVNLENIDDCLVYKHNYGCSQLGDDLENTRKILTDIVKHPNAGGVLVLGLGCENNVVDEFKKELGKFDNDRTKFLITQTVSNEIEEGVKLLMELYETMRNDVRVEVPISKLKIGLKCGGSDGFSGITANPLLGEFSDYIVYNGGITILTEVPEMFGAETILMERAESEEVFEDIVELINNFKEYFLAHNLPIYENPSPGNKEDQLLKVNR